MERYSRYEKRREGRQDGRVHDISASGDLPRAGREVEAQHLAHNQEQVRGQLRDPNLQLLGRRKRALQAHPQDPTQRFETGNNVAVIAKCPQQQLHALRSPERKVSERRAIQIESTRSMAKATRGWRRRGILSTDINVVPRRRAHTFGSRRRLPSRDPR